MSGRFEHPFSSSPATFNFSGADYIAKLTTSGTLVWAENSSDETSYNFDTDDAGNLYFTNWNHLWNTDWFTHIIKWDSNGNEIWVSTVSSTSFINTRSLLVTDLGIIYAAGVFTGTADLDPTPGTSIFTSLGGSLNDDAFTYKLLPSCASSPHSFYDPIYVQVIADDPYCCSTAWDATCQSAYNTLLTQDCVESPYNSDDPIYVEVIQDDPFCCETEWDNLCQDAYDVYVEACADSPYEPDDPVYLQVIYEDPYCCNTAWDGICEGQYYDISVGATLEGSVTWNAACGIKPAVLQFYNPGSTTLEHTYNVSIYTSGQFLLEGAATGSFDIYLKVNGYLKKSIGTQTITANNQFSFGAITPGELTGDNQVNLLDFSVLGGAFGKTPGQSGYNALADINCDGNITVIDISIMSPLFGLTGDNPSL